MSILTLQTISIKRKERGTYDRGTFVPGAETEISIKGNAQPYRNMKMIRENFGERIEDAIIVFSVDELMVKTTSSDSDVVVYNGREYIVSDVRYFGDVLPNSSIAPHYETIAILERGAE